MPAEAGNAVLVGQGMVVNAVGHGYHLMKVYDDKEKTCKLREKQGKILKIILDLTRKLC